MNTYKETKYEIICNIFSYLDLVQRNHRIPFVCILWSHSFIDCGYFIFLQDSHREVLQQRIIGNR